MPFTIRNLVPAAAIAALVLLVACGGGDDDDASPTDDAQPSSSASVTPVSGTCDKNLVSEPIERELLPLVISSDLAVGSNRFQVGLLDQNEGTPLAGATLHLQFICFNTDEGTPVSEADPEPVTLTKTYTHTHADGTIESHEAGETGAYITYVDFDRPGNWGVIVSGETADGRTLDPTGLTFNVNAAKFGLSVGDPAPLTVQPLASDVEDIRDIDTSTTPIEEQHNLTIAAAVTSGKPTVIAFATPAYCQSQICGPVKEIMDDLYDSYKDDANFVHVEPYDVTRMRSGECPSLADCIVPAVDEWRLPDEPWTFVVGADGNVAAAFGGIASFEEIEAALKQALGESPSS